MRIHAKTVTHARSRKPSALKCRSIEMEYSSSNCASSTISDQRGIGGFVNSRCLRCLRCCVSCNRIVSVEPVAFLYVFAAYAYISTFELYAFNVKGWKELGGYNGTCATTGQLNADGARGTKTANYVQSEVAVLNLYVGVASQIPGILSALLLGPFSDRYGRRIAMGVVTFGLVLQSLLANVIIEFQLDLHYFVLSSALRTLFGGLAGLLTTSYSYIADISPRKWLTLRLGILEAVTFIASSLGLVVSGLWIQVSNCHFIPVTWLILAAAAALALYLIIFVRESLNRQQTLQRRLLLTTGPKSLLVGFKIFLDRSRGVSLWKLWFCLATMCITILNQMGTLTTVTLFALHEPLEWRPGLIGGYLATSEFIRGLSVIILLPIMVTCSLQDPLIALIGVCFAFGTNIGIGFVNQTWQMFLVGALQGVDAVIAPAVKAIMSKLVPPQEQGALFSLISAIQVLSGAAAFVLYSLAYKTSLEMGWSAGSPFWLMALLYTITIPLLIALVTFSKRTGDARRVFVNPESCSSSSASPSSMTHSSTPISTSIQHPPPQTHYCRPHEGGQSDDDVESVEWALSKSHAQHRPPPMLSPASFGRDVLERQSDQS